MTTPLTTGGKSAGAIRVSTGVASTLANVQRFVDVAASFRNQTALSIGTVSFDIEVCRVVRDGGLPRGSTQQRRS